MVTIADFHIHSKFSLATSPLMVPVSIAQAAGRKGIGLVGTGDFLHPGYLNILNESLEEEKHGIYRLKKGKSKVAFMPTVEVSNIFRTGGKTRKIHTLIFTPSLRDCAKLSKIFGKLGKTSSNGRPIFKFHVKELLKRVLDCSPESFIVPAHAWTPWYSVFGAFSGFDSIEECFEEESYNIFSIETGLSSDPPMNWSISGLDRMTLISNSDAHSPSKLGREANVFSKMPDFKELKSILKGEKREFFLNTIEFYPQEGKYFTDGHRKCGISFDPEETKANGDRCPECGGKVTKGVLHRVRELSDRKHGSKPVNAIPPKYVIPLEEIIAFVVNKKVTSLHVKKIYEKMIESAGTEFHILLDAAEDELKSMAAEEIALAILAVREGRVDITPGYDGVFGKIKICDT
ncbi:MAG: DNA helicase UvrD [Candidatus Schekmanbacteria bacterium]|nr:DNA helicase UvrD [Candidatus Schekmanbacteria bacterium]